MTAAEAALDAPPEVLEQPSFGSVMRNPGVRALLSSSFAKQEYASTRVVLHDLFGAGGPAGAAAAKPTSVEKP